MNFLNFLSLGGVIGLVFPMDILFVGLSIWNEQVRFSSTDIKAPALSNSPQ